MRINYQAIHPYADHPAMAATKALADKIGTGVYLLGLYARLLPDTGWLTPVSPLLLTALHPNVDLAQAVLTNYMAQIAQFYHDVQMPSFLIQQADVY
ncbi:hypothetical protein [Spirosoma pulveris]